jgi:hypothetical protein
LQLDCALTDAQLTELFGRGSKEGLLHWVKDGTVLLNNVDKVSWAAGAAHLPLQLSWPSQLTDMPCGQRKSQGAACQYIMYAILTGVPCLVFPSHTPPLLQLPRYLVPQLVSLMKDNIYQPAPAVLPTGSLDMPAPLCLSSARILMTAETHMPELEGACTVIRCPPLRVRPADILDMQRYLLRIISRQRGEALSLTPEAERQLLSYG